MRNKKPLCSHSNYVCYNVCFMSPLNGLFVTQTVHQHESSKPGGGVDKLGLGVIIFSQVFSMISNQISRLSVDNVVVL